MSAFTSLEPGSIAGKYVVIRELGRGGMGVVYLAEDTSLSREVALKVLYPSLSTDSVFIDRFKAEARIVAAILHSNIVRINSLETLGQSLAIDMEYVSGSSLGQMMTQTVFTPQLAVQIARDTLEGLAICHELGIVHRDIKPNNILLSVDGHAKLADFGLATAYATHLESSIYRLSSSEFFMGTPRFAPPEAWEGGHPKPDWDLYSLGIVLYEGLAGKPVYDGTTPLAIVKQLMSQPVPPLRDAVPNVSDELARFIDRLAARDQPMRPADAAVALSELRNTPEYAHAVGDDAPTIRTAVRSVQRRTSIARHAKRTRRVVTWATAALSLILASGLATWSILRPGRPLDPVLARSTANTTLPTQQELCQRKLLSVADVLEHPKTAADAGSRVFNARYLRAGAASGLELNRTERWLITREGASNKRRLIGISDRFLMVADLLETAPGTSTLTGDWASYQFDFGAGFQFGTMKGVGTWMVPDSALNLSLRIENQRSHEVEEFTVAVMLANDWKTESHFAYEFERAPLLQSLLFSELAPRHELWAESLFELLPSVYDAKCTVPIIREGSPASIDGILNEELWTQQFFDTKGRIGSLTGFPTMASAILSARATERELLLGIAMPWRPARSWGVCLAAMPILPGPRGELEVMKVEAYSDSSPRYTFFKQGVERPWEGETWQIELGVNDDGVSCEMAIPTEGLTSGIDLGEGDVWRVNACIVERDNATDQSTIAAWGFPEFNAVEHGAILQFEKHFS